MYIFIKKLFLFIFVVLISSVGLNYKYKHTNGFKINLGIDKFLIDKVPSNIKIANFGSSHGQFGFDYSKIGISGFNFGMSSQTFYYDLQILKKYIGNIKENGIIIIPISYFSLSATDIFVESDKPRYYNFLDRESINDYSYIEDFKYHIFPIVTAGESIRFIIKDKDIEKEKISDEKNIYGEKELEEVGKKRASYHLNGIKERLGKENGLILKNIKYLKEINTLAKKNKIKVVLVTTPYTKYYNNNFSIEYLNDNFYSIINRLAKEMDVKYLDYSHDKRFQNNYNLFKDSDHLNLIGRKKFTNIVINDLKNLQIFN